MYEYSIVVPFEYLDEIRKVMGDEAEFSYAETLLPWTTSITTMGGRASLSTALLAPLSVKSPDLKHVGRLKEWMESCLECRFMDIWVQGPSGGFDFRFGAHTLAEIEGYIAGLTSKRAA